MLLCLQRNRRGEEQDQDVCSAESHTAQRTTQGHHPGRGRQVSNVYHLNVKQLLTQHFSQDPAKCPEINLSQINKGMRPELGVTRYKVIILLLSVTE